MSIIIKSNKHFDDCAMFLIRATEESTKTTTEGDVTFISDSKGIVGINVNNSSQYFKSNEGVHTLNDEQTKFLAKHKVEHKHFFEVGQVLSRVAHPTSGKLFVLEVQGTEKHTIVTNSLNSLVDTKVVFARVGAVLPSGKPILLSKVMGVESHGMLCGYKTLGIDNETEGVITVDGSTKNGSPFEY